MKDFHSWMEGISVSEIGDFEELYGPQISHKKIGDTIYRFYRVQRSQSDSPPKNYGITVAGIKRGMVIATYQRGDGKERFAGIAGDGQIRDSSGRPVWAPNGPIPAEKPGRNIMPIIEIMKDFL